MDLEWKWLDIRKYTSDETRLKLEGRSRGLIPLRRREK
jgi:hypothetical protein